jgi:hypothetical protein
MGLMSDSTSITQVIVSFISNPGKAQLRCSLSVRSGADVPNLNSINLWKLAQISQPANEFWERKSTYSALHLLHSCFYRFPPHLTVWLVGLYDSSHCGAQKLPGFRHVARKHKMFSMGWRRIHCDSMMQERGLASLHHHIHQIRRVRRHGLRVLSLPTMNSDSGSSGSKDSSDDGSLWMSPQPYFLCSNSRPK